MAGADVFGGTATVLLSVAGRAGVGGVSTAGATSGAFGFTGVVCAGGDDADFMDAIFFSRSCILVLSSRDMSFSECS